MSIRDTIAENFRNLPLNDLIREAQQPSGKYRLYDILGQIQLKKDEAEKAAASQTQAPQTTVVQDLQQFVNTPPPPPPGLAGLPQAQPMMQAMAPPPEMPVQQMAQGGLAELDTGDMFNEQSYAQGGIVAFADGGDSNKEDALGLSNLSPDMSVDPNAGAGNLAMLQSAMQPTQGQMSDQSNDSLIAEVIANLKADPNYQPENPIEAAIVKQIRGTDPMQQGQPSEQGLGSLAPAQPSQPMAPSYNPSQPMAPSYAPSVAMGPTYFAGMNAPQGYADGGEVKHFQQGGPSQATLKYQAALADSYLDPRYLVSGAQDLVSRNLFGYRVVRDPVTGELIQAKDLPSSTDALRKKKKSEVEELLDKAKKVEDERKSATAKKENLTELDPTLAAATFSKDALYKDPNMSELYNMAKPRIQALPEKGKVPPNATQEFNPYANVEKPKSTVNTAEETAKRFQEMMGADPERETLMKKVQDLELGSKEQERMAPWLALTKAGFGIAAGKSPFALQNIGEGAQLGISEYVAARDRLDKLNERQVDIRAKLNQVQRGEKAAGVSAGLTKELKQMEEDNANARNAATNQVQLKTAAIAAAKKSDYETYLSIAQQDPDNYKIVKNPETGESTKVFDAPKVTQAYKSFSGSSGLDDDKLLPLWQNEKMIDKNFKMSFQEYANMMRSKLGGTTQSATPTKTLNNIFK
jgi:hypothetical protein